MAQVRPMTSTLGVGLSLFDKDLHDSEFYLAEGRVEILGNV